MNKHPTLTFNDGHSIPQLGLGVWRATPDQARDAVREALQAGYRHVDTASIYKNESGVGAGVKESGLARKDVFLTTKIWNDAQGKTAPRQALMQSLERLGVAYVDLLLIHWPVPSQDLYVDTWAALTALRDEGLTRSIGVSNFTEAHLERTIQATGVTPALNQIELHPYLQQHAMRRVHERLGVLTESWSPLAQNRALEDAAVAKVAAKHGKTPAQVVIRWHLDLGFVVIPKSVTPERIRANAQVFDFTLDAADLATLAKLDRHQRLGPDPETFGA